MFSVEDFRFLVHIAGSKSLAEVSRKLNVTPSAVTQRLKQIEERSGVCLVDRSTRQLSLTGEGEMVVAYSHRVLYDVEELIADLEKSRNTVVGKLCIVAPLQFGRLYVAPAISRFCKQFPKLKIELDLSESPNVLFQKNYDLAIHIGELPDSGLYVRKLAPNKRLICAAPSYVNIESYPRTPDDLRHLRCIVIRENNEDVTMWRFAKAGKISHIRIDPKYSSNDGEVVRNWVLDGHGIMVRSEWDIASDLKEGRLVQLLPDYTLPDANVVALLSHRAGRAARVSAFLDAFHKELTPVPWRGD